MINVKNAYSKVCGIAYDLSDIDRIVAFAIKHNYYYYYIEHSPEELASEEDEDFKLHYHFIIESDSKRRFNVGCLLTDSFKANLFEKCDNVIAYLRYMVHADYDFKIKYDYNDIKTNNLNYQDSIIEMCFGYDSNKSASQIAFEKVLEYIMYYKPVNLTQVIMYCINNNIKYLANWTATCRTLIEENFKYAKKNKIER